jgi:hypothetical protein
MIRYPSLPVKSGGTPVKRSILIGIVGAAIAGVAAVATAMNPAPADAGPVVTVYKTPT